MTSGLGYGHWGWVAFNSIGWLVVTFVLIRPRTPGEWCAWTLFAVFVVEEFVELYGIPFTLNLFAERVAEYGALDQLSHRAGDLWRTLLPWDDTMGSFDMFHIVGGIFIFGGLGIIIFAWLVLKDAQANGLPATIGPYAWVRHPQYLGLISIMVGFNIQGPTLFTLGSIPLLVALYVRLARREETAAIAEFGHAYGAYMQRTPGFLPRGR